MINKILASTFFVSCLFALFLSLSGVVGPVWFGNEFRAFIVTTNRELQSYKIAIPDIPLIPELDFVSFGSSFLSTVIALFNNLLTILVKFLNGLIVILNFVILALNTIIQLLEFVFILLKNIILMKDEIISA